MDDLGHIVIFDVIRTSNTMYNTVHNNNHHLFIVKFGCGLDGMKSFIRPH